MAAHTPSIVKKSRAILTAETRIKILEAAERLFADRGVDGVGLREIAAAAEQGNTAAVQYHFGSKERLVYAIFEYRTHLFEPLRETMLADAEQQGRLGDIRTLLEIICLPHLSIGDAQGRHPYSAFLAHYVTRSHSPGMPHPYENPEAPMPALRRTRRLIAERIDHIPANVLRMRFQLAKLMFLNMLTKRDNTPDSERLIPLSDSVDDVLNVMSAGIAIR